ncbi:MAG: S1-like domain-containing RNA-binding protein [Lachnospiraceae bacterium]|nr:S1-like domain-containing RNA-binding protein [Lachnospiraceae bacterium]
MIELGKLQTLYMVKRTNFGVYLNDEAGKLDGRILLPKKQVPQDMQNGDAIKVFVYKDSEDRPIATTHVPKLTLGELAVLKVVSLSSIGAFLDWGLEKDLFLPFKEQTQSVKEGKEYLVTLYIDKSERLCASMKIYDSLSTDSPYKKDDHVTGTIYSINEDFGAFIAIDNKYHGMIPIKELHKKIYIGDTIQARVTRVREDGKLDLSLREKAYIQMDTDCDLVMSTIESYDGVLPFTDKASPAVIERELGLSKNAFKRAVGRLLKQGKIQINPHGIRKI